MPKSFCSLLVFTFKQHEITQTLIAYNRQTVRGAIPLTQRIAFPLIDTAIFFGKHPQDIGREIERVG